jgi:hypothetical protein
MVVRDAVHAHTDERHHDEDHDCDDVPLLAPSPRASGLVWISVDERTVRHATHIGGAAQSLNRVSGHAGTAAEPGISERDGARREPPSDARPSTGEAGCGCSIAEVAPGDTGLVPVAVALLEAIRAEALVSSASDEIRHVIVDPFQGAPNFETFAL